MEGRPNKLALAAIVVCLVSLFLGWHGFNSGVLQKLRLGSNLGRGRPAPSTSALLDASSRISVLLVMDPPIYSWEYVRLDDFALETVIGWMRGLTDALTATSEVPGGLPLLVRYV
jgi:hypothetical protein